MAKRPATTRARRKPAMVTEDLSADANGVASRRSYLRQSEVPHTSLDDALRVPKAIYDHYAGKPTSPLYIAKALNVDPKGSQLRVLTGAAIAFGPIDGGAQAASIGPTELARRIVRPRVEDEDIIAKREAVLRPRIFGEFLGNYNGSPFPRRDLALNVLEGMGVPREKGEEVFERIEASARSVGYLEEIKGKLYVSLSATNSGGEADISAADTTRRDEPDGNLPEQLAPLPPSGSTNNEVTPKDILLASNAPNRGATLAAAFADDQRRRRVFITHGKDRALVEPIRKLLEYGELEPVISVERQSVSKPVPEKIMDDMRKCGAAIIHVDNEMVLTGDDGEKHAVLNPNVLIEIGAAMAFYGRRFILLVKDGVKLPSNLQGLYEVRYSDNTLDAGATIKLLEAMKDIKNYGLPGDTEQDS